MVDKTNECQNVDDLGQTLLDIAKSFNTGEMVRIIAKTQIGIEWQSKYQGVWFMQTPTILGLLKNWDGFSDVNWFWNAVLYEGTEVTAYTLVPAKMMQEIKDYIEQINELAG